jgi:hypothetical protein
MKWKKRELDSDEKSRRSHLHSEWLSGCRAVGEDDAPR